MSKNRPNNVAYNESRSLFFRFLTVMLNILLENKNIFYKMSYALSPFHMIPNTNFGVETVALWRIMCVQVPTHISMFKRLDK